MIHARTNANLDMLPSTVTASLRLWIEDDSHEELRGVEKSLTAQQQY